MAWSIEGSYVETCSCDLFCPCNASLALGASNDYCRALLVFDISKGDIDGTDVAGTKVAAIIDTPKVMTDGNWKLGMFVDSESDEQAEKLTAVFGGQLGGPMEALGPLVGELLGVERTRIEVRTDGLHHSVRVGDAARFDSEDVVPFGSESGEPVRLVGMFHPAGSEMTLGRALSSEIDAFGIKMEGKTGISNSRFAWAA